jgi:regulator of protease activity HflC (stomatin/prohibitin superfamily)
MKFFLPISGIVVGLIILGLVFASFETIAAGERGVVLVWGKPDRILTEGFQIVNPITSSIITLDVKTQKENADVLASSKDLQTVSATVALNYHLDPLKVDLLWSNIGKDYKERIIDPAIQESTKASTAKYTAEELITKRASVRDDIKNSLIERLSKEYIIVDELSIVNFQFSESFNAAIEAKVTAEQNALAAKNKLEQVKFEAEQRVATATAEAEAIKIQAAAITQQGGQDYVQLKSVEKWDGVLPTYMMGSSVPFINIK